MEEKKQCTGCRCDKPLGDFYTKRAAADGRTTRCKECIRAANTKHRKANPEYFTTYIADYRAKPANKARAIHRRARLKAEAQSIPFDLSAIIVSRKLIRGVCERTGVRLDLTSAGANPFAPVLDMLNPHHGFTDKNTVVVCNAYVAGRGNLSHGDYVKFCEQVTAFNKV